MLGSEEDARCDAEAGEDIERVYEPSRHRSRMREERDTRATEVRNE